MLISDATSAVWREPEPEGETHYEKQVCVRSMGFNVTLVQVLRQGEH